MLSVSDLSVSHNWASTWVLVPAVGTLALAGFASRWPHRVGFFLAMGLACLCLGSFQLQPCPLRGAETALAEPSLESLLKKEMALSIAIQSRATAIGRLEAARLESEDPEVRASFEFAIELHRRGIEELNATRRSLLIALSATQSSS